MNLRIWQDQCWRPATMPVITAADGSFLFGDTLFETLLVRDGRPLFLREHLDRLELSAHLSEFPFDRTATTTLVNEALSQMPSKSYRLRLTLSRGVFQGLSFPEVNSLPLLTLAPHDEVPDVRRNQGWRAVSAPNQRVNPLSHLPQMKRGNYADCLYAFNHARKCGVDEALFFTPDQLLLEGSISNVFLIRDGQLRTPQLGTLVLAGVIRRQLLNLAESAGLEASEAAIGDADLFLADEVFLCNSLMLMMPLVELDGRPLRRGEEWKVLLEKLAAQAVRGFNE